MVKLLGETKLDIAAAQAPPTVILVAGLQGSGKTTFSAKLANYLKSKGRFPLLVAADVHRPAAIDQLEMLGKTDRDSGIFGARVGAVKIAQNSIDFARRIFEIQLSSIQRDVYMSMKR